MINYKEELLKAMNLLAENGYLFLGQCVRYSGTSMFHTIKHLPEERRIELPVFEDIQAGMSLGMALEGQRICSIYPRWDFMLLALNQIVNHADKVKRMSNGQFKAKGLIFRVAVGSVKPLFPGEQHCGDYTEALQLMCKDIKVVKLTSPEMVFKTYREAIDSDVPTVIVELPDLYNEEFKQEFIDSRKGTR